MRIIIEMTDAESRQSTVRQEAGGQLANGATTDASADAPTGAAGLTGAGWQAAAGAATSAIDAGPPPPALLLAVEGDGETQDTAGNGAGRAGGRGDAADGADGGEPAAWLVDSLSTHAPHRFG